MEQLRSVLASILYLYFIVLLARLVFDWIQVFAREWRPKGPVLVVAEGVYTLTDPPLKALRKVIPPLRLGQVRLDLAFLVLMLSVSLLLSVIS
ncbi:YggT family protein [Yimella lutea]|uniref:YggT family protein n=1 Tax=Yimella lutea TaxID=587872 RepID=A0A542EFT8_9MICO|nr:YggT family protein [Yimella lutea]TQJ14188.1 YggT family protein [Yimella lutea]